MKKGFPIFAVIMLLLVTEDGAAQPVTVTVNFVFEFRGQPMDFGKRYTTESGETIQIDRVRFYLSGLQLSSIKDTADEAGSGIRLIDSRDTGSLHVRMAADSPASLSSIAFWLGVDSANQVSGARTGPLDPLNGMYWTWNSGYVAVKIEGHSPAAATVGRQVEYHLGGYRAPNAVRTAVDLKTGKAFEAVSSDKASIDIPIDLGRFFSDHFSIKKLPAFMTPGPMARHLMIRFKTCFLPPRVHKTDE